jgi:anti-sigma B factor antagonist
VRDPSNIRPGAFPISWTSRLWRPDVRYVAVFGELDMHTTPSLLDALTQPDVVGVSNLVVDLSGVTFLGAAGINALLAAARLRRHRRTHLVGLAASPSVRRAVDITGAGDLLVLHDDLDQCLRSIEPR